MAHDSCFMNIFIAYFYFLVSAVAVRGENTSAVLRELMHSSILGIR